MRTTYSFLFCMLLASHFYAMEMTNSPSGTLKSTIQEQHKPSSPALEAHLLKHTTAWAQIEKIDDTLEAHIFALSLIRIPPQLQEQQRNIVHACALHKTTTQYYLGRGAGTLPMISAPSLHHYLAQWPSYEEELTQLIHPFYAQLAALQHAHPNQNGKSN